MPIVSTAAVTASLIGALGTSALIAGGATAAGLSAAGAKKQAQKRKETLLAAEGEGIKATEFAKGAPGRAKQAAAEELKKQRRIRELAGGKTLLASAPTGKTVLG